MWAGFGVYSYHTPSKSYLLTKESNTIVRHVIDKIGGAGTLYISILPYKDIKLL